MDRRKENIRVDRG